MVQAAVWFPIPHFTTTIKCIGPFATHMHMHILAHFLCCHFDWEDDFRFKLIADKCGTSQAHSKTKTITAYTIPCQQGSPFEHTLTIVDTPGFGELDSGRCIVEQIWTFFSLPGKKGIDHIHGIGFVTQASMAPNAEMHL